tara:strand:- start:265 stop:429 length:165 start_codon:yes stop_codon:yes gene_type:complete
VNNLWVTFSGFSLNSFSTSPQALFKLKPNPKPTNKPKQKSQQKKLSKHNNKNNI